MTKKPRTSARRAGLLCLKRRTVCSGTSSSNLHRDIRRLVAHGLPLDFLPRGFSCPFSNLNGVLNSSSVSVEFACQGSMLLFGEFNDV